MHTTDGKNFDWDLQATLSYNRTFEKHNLNFLLGYNARSTKSKSISAEYRGFPSGELNSPNYAEEIYEKPTISDNHTRLVGFLGTLNYSYDKKLFIVRDSYAIAMRDYIVAAFQKSTF